ncbi:TonB-dependent siderophore receptor [Variovorax sp.]|uniref:TonB-dependent siderophore receptor n=1 Tax=Variovorax sp. TaxID=1871043 RepID=UPI003BACA524
MSVRRPSAPPPLARTARAARALCLGLAFAALGPAAGALAAEPAPPEARADYDIPAGPLSHVLAQFAAQAGVPLSFDPATLDGLRSPGLRGRFGMREGFARLLAGSGHALVDKGSRSYSLGRVAAPAAVTPPLSPAGAAQLPEVRVNADPAPPTLADDTGFVARRSAMGTKTDTALVETPQAISVISRQEMDARGVQTVTEALRYVPGVAIETYGPDSKGYDWLMIRGFNGQATSDYRDGLRQASYSYALFRTEPYGMERIEVLRGPSSVLYGQAEAGGLVSRTSKRPTGTRLREVEAGAGTHEVKQGAFDIGDVAGEDGRVAWRLTGFARDGNNVFDDRNDRAYLAGAVRWKLSGDTEITFLADYLRDRSTLANNWSWTWPGPVPTHISYSERGFDRFHQNQGSVGWELEHRIGEQWRLRQNARVGDVDVPVFNKTMLNGLRADGRTLNRYAFRREENLRQVAIDNQLAGRVALGDTVHELLLGLDLSRVKAHAQRWIGAEPTLDLLAPVYGQAFALPATAQLDSRVAQYQSGIYLQDQVRFGERWLATLGGRWDRARTTTDNRLNGQRQAQRDQAFSGRAALSYGFASGVVPYASYATSFLPLIGTNTATGAAFEPTRGKQFELGLKYQPPGSDSLYTAALFDLRKTNAATTDGLTGFTRQVGETRSRGLELEAKTSPARRWNLVFNYTYNDVEVTRSDVKSELGRRPALVSRHIASVWSDYRFDGALASFGVGAGLRYVGKTYGDAANQIAVGGRTLLDLALYYELPHWRFALNVSNALDKRYLSTCASSACYWGAERSALLSARYSF